jgi:hypothetical protein
MTKRKKLVFALLALLVLGTGAFLYFRSPEKPIRINGNLAPEELAAVKSIVQREMWRNTFPNWSFKTFRNLPGGIKTTLSLHIESIDILSDDGWRHKMASVQMVSGKSSRDAAGSYICAKSSNQWVVVARIGPTRYIDSKPSLKITP